MRLTPVNSFLAGVGGAENASGIHLRSTAAEAHASHRAAFGKGQRRLCPEFKFKELRIPVFLDTVFNLIFKWKGCGEEFSEGGYETVS